MRTDPTWQALSNHAARLHEKPLRELIAGDRQRSRDFSLHAGPIYANFARQRYDRDARGALLELARAAGMSDATKRLFAGEPVNASEHRPALHTALRSRISDSPIANAAFDEAATARRQMAGLVAELAQSNITDLIHVGIGGSDLGPRLAVDALREFGDGRIRIHFLNNADGHPVQRLLPTLDRSRTGVVLVSKSFSTQETLLNGQILKDWLGQADSLYAVSANVDRASAFGIDRTRILPIWDWVGGRYSLWSTVGFSVALAIGMENFEAMLAGGAEMDAHVLDAPEDNIALWHALTAIWNRNGLGLDSHAVVPYDERLALLPAYLQQLVMESLGKSVQIDGNPVVTATAPVLWGGAGTSSQHSFFQALHQGTDTVPVDFIGVAQPAHSFAESHRVQLAHLLAQAEALANGEDNADPQKRYAGNRPSTMLLVDRLDPRSFGALISMYEHSVHAQSVLWRINAFDQWGVELGKRVADRLLPAITDAGANVADPVTEALLREIRRR